MSPPSPTHHNIVVLQGQYYKPLHFDLPPPFTHTLTVYPDTPLSELHSRIHDATILVTSVTRLDAVALSAEVTPYLQFIAVVAVGTDCVDLDACRKRGIIVSNCPNANVEAVSEHAIALYFAARRRVLEMHSLTRAGEWAKRGTLMFDMLDQDRKPPLTCEEEVVGIVGYGAVGKRITQLARNLGMKILISTRKGVSTDSNQLDEVQRTPFEEVLQKSTVLFIAVPRTPSTLNLISTAELQSMSRQAVLVNVSRGGIVDEAALVTALKERWIMGAATDVFLNEPASPQNSPLLADDTRDLNLTVSPHLAWLAERTQENQRRIAKEIVEGFCAGRPCNVVT
ncbi:hypothetical protein VTN77DRAFT_8928 [Rasamsonia byssochlamydoides]|uniref:uncharacterized protein n=1 Tax=Rasamsonia byssochlamydoides TaxID=89139 RepID=UPI003743F286